MSLLDEFLDDNRKALSPPAQLFLLELTQICLRHGVNISTSSESMLVLSPIEAGDTRVIECFVVDHLK